MVKFMPERLPDTFVGKLCMRFSLTVEIFDFQCMAMFVFFVVAIDRSSSTITHALDCFRCSGDLRPGLPRNKNITKAKAKFVSVLIFKFTTIVPNNSNAGRRHGLMPTLGFKLEATMKSEVQKFIRWLG